MVFKVEAYASYCANLMGRDGRKKLNDGLVLTRTRRKRVRVTFLMVAVSPVNSPASNGEEPLNTLTETDLFEARARPTALISI